MLQLIDDPDKMEYYETVRDAGAQLITGLVSTLTKCTVESTEETTRMADTVSALSSSTAFLPREAQVRTKLLLGISCRDVNTSRIYISRKATYTPGHLCVFLIDVC